MIQMVPSSSIILKNGPELDVDLLPVTSLIDEIMIQLKNNITNFQVLKGGYNHPVQLVLTKYLCHKICIHAL